MLQGSLRTEMQAVQETNQLLRKYIAEMTGIIQPDLYGREMVVDRNDIFANIITMAEQSERLLNLDPYTIIWSGDVCTRFPDAQTRKKEELYYKKVHDLLDRTVPAYGRQIVADIGRIMLLYDDKIKGYENMDDEYASLARELYLKYTGEERRMYRHNELWCRAEENVLTGMWDALADIVIEPVLLLTEAGNTGIACMYYCMFDQLGWEKPDWMTERVEGFARGTQAIANDPFLLVEGMAQEITDTYEEKGIFYCGGYIGSSILITKGIDKAVRSARLMGGAGEVSGRTQKVFRGAGRLDDVDDYLALDQADFDELLRMGLGESGSKTALLEELANSGVKYNPEEVVIVIKNSDGKLMWLEKGNSKAGLTHILERHADDFAAQGVSDIPNLLESVLATNPIKTGSNAKGLYADYAFNGNSYRVAYGANGFVVSFYPID